MIELTTGVVVEVKVTEYAVRCEIALSRACRIAASVMLYAFVTRWAFNNGIRLMTETTVTIMLSASTIVISSKLKPLARCLRSAFVSRFVINILLYLRLPASSNKIVGHFL